MILQLCKQARSPAALLHVVSSPRCDATLPDTIIDTSSKECIKITILNLGL
jgi:hypothetical protein